MNRFILIAIFAALTGPCLAQPASESKALQLKVRPSGYEKERNDAVERQEKLLRRLERSDHMVRSICINCGDAWKHQIYAPFNPLASLKSSGGLPAEEAN